MKFTKMEGCANDFIVTHEVTGDAEILGIAQRAAALCDRRRGIGADGVVLVLPSSRADFRMRIFNADGSEPEMCGNGIRCFAKYVREIGLCSKDSLTVETGAGIITPEFAGNLIRVNMGPPIFDGEKIPTTRKATRIMGEQLTVNGKSFAVTAVSMGNPHAVIFVDEITDELLTHYGPQLETHPFFPRKANIEFAKILSASEISMRVFERGVGETMACGTGACATAIAGMINGKSSTRVTVHLLGGDLEIEWDGTDGHPVYMTGPAVKVYEGCIE